MIDKKIFSIYTQMSNLTDTPSQIRFGAYNTALFSGTELWWINTLNRSTWQLPLSRLDFKSNNVLGKTVSVLMNPSFPFIAAPYDDFVKFRADLNSTTAVQNYNLTCSALDWCYFKTSCDNVVNQLPNLTFYLGAGEQMA